jgi:hypothetical protein
MSITLRTTFARYVRGSRYTRTSGYAEIQPTVTNMVSGCYTIPYVPEIIQVDGQDHAFAFMSVTGAEDGNSIQTDPDYCIPIGSTEVNVLLVYIPIGGGDGPPVLMADAFLIDAGRFSNSDFADVLVNGTADPGLSATINEFGMLSTGQEGLRIRAYEQVDTRSFSFWLKIGLRPHPERSYSVSAHETGLTIAFYNMTVNQPPKVEAPKFGWFYVSPGVKVDGGGIVIGPKGPMPVPPWGGWLIRLTMRMASRTRSVATPNAILSLAQRLQSVSADLHRMVGKF